MNLLPKSFLSIHLQVGDEELEVFEGLVDSKGVVAKELFCQFAKVGRAEAAVKYKTVTCHQTIPFLPNIF